MKLVEAYLTSQVEVCVVCNVYGCGSCCSGFHTEDQLIGRCELVCHLGENCSWESFFTILTDITQGELVIVQIWLPHNLTQKQREVFYLLMLSVVIQQWCEMNYILMKWYRRKQKFSEKT